MTAPMQGNYGADREVWESRKIWIEGFICLQVQDSLRDQAWKTRLLESKIPLMSELDTRSLVFRLRSGGTPWGALVCSDSETAAKARAKTLIEEKKKLEKDWVHLASRKEVEVRRGDQMIGPRIAILDFGSKENIFRELQSRSSELRIFPSRTSAAEILASNPDGIMLTNGPGDPADVQVAIETVRELLGKKPIFGICMGHQILGLALGAKTYKLKFGHRGSNHPIKDELLQQIYVTSQNHGYAVDRATLPEDVKVTHTNLNDGTVAGFYSEKRKCLGIQYHPESCPGPHEASGLFSYFIGKMI
jgi:carbamoyl-phosphate synthase small subunit